MTNVLAQGHNPVAPVRLEPAAPWSRVKHSTTEPLRSHILTEKALINKFHPPRASNSKLITKLSLKSLTAEFQKCNIQISHLS